MNKIQLQEQFQKLRAGPVKVPQIQPADLPPGFEHMSLKEILRVIENQKRTPAK